ncbi:MAG: MBL fold metallo-hydrolase [Blastocatellia bacterium]|nr:MBL fold metallo-hydrolase [Blastocatellia bacterium]
MKITFLGTGTSVGIPMIGCQCETCLSCDTRDKRLRASIVLENHGKKILVDPSIDFRQQALRERLDTLDAIFVTHCHADHVFGLDDIRPINFRSGVIGCYASETTWRELKRIFSYVFKPFSLSSLPQIFAHTIEGKFSIFGLEVTPLEVIHGRLPVTAFRFNKTALSVAYVTDCNIIPENTLEQLQNLDLLILDALRHREHPTHLTLEKSLKYIEQLRPRRALLTHMSHDLKHEVVSNELPENVALAYDGLQVNL